MAEGIDQALHAGDRGRVLFMLAQHGIRSTPGSSSKGSALFHTRVGHTSHELRTIALACYVTGA